MHYVPRAEDVVSRDRSPNRLFQRRISARGPTVTLALFPRIEAVDEIRALTHCARFQGRCRFTQDDVPNPCSL